jgi:ammonia channel protein AmtB
MPAVFYLIGYSLAYCGTGPFIGGSWGFALLPGSAEDEVIPLSSFFFQWAFAAAACAQP